MKIKFLLIGTSLSLIPTLTYAQCVATQDCETLGYTETSCNGGKGVKCPFGNKWACIGISTEECSELGFTYTCTGTGYSGGSGPACNGKYTACTCASGYDWKDGNCQKQILNGPDGDVYKCNGIVVGVKTADMNFYVAMKDLGYMFWDEANSSCLNYIFCNNIKGTLPTKEQLDILYNNKAQINTLLLANGGNQISEKYHWSSTSDTKYYYVLDMFNGYTYWHVGNNDYYARPILTSW